MKVDRFEISRYSIPLLHPLSDATHGVIRDFALVTVLVRTRDGLEGIGYTYTVGSTGGGAIASLIAEDLAPIVVGQDPRAVSSLSQSMWRATHYVGRGGPASFAISAVDIALWDIKAKAVGEPLWRLLGGHDPKVPAYASGIDLNSSIPELEQSARIHRERGFRAIKMKVGKPRLAEDILRVEAIRELLGPDAPLMVDANMKWGVHEALRASRALAEYDVYWLEEPIAPGDTEGYVRIQREGPVPIAARGEPSHSRRVREHDLGGRGGVSRARRNQLRRCDGMDKGVEPRRGPQSAGDIPRCAGPSCQPAGRSAQPVIPRNPWIRIGALPRTQSADRRGMCNSIAASGARDRIPLGRTQAALGGMTPPTAHVRGASTPRQVPVQTARPLRVPHRAAGSCCVVALLLGLSVVPDVAAQTATVIRNAQVIDGTGRPPMPAADIVIQGSRIVALSATGSGQAPPDARVLDASGKTVIPGIINLRGLAGLVRSPERTAAPFSRTEIARQLRIYASYGVTTTTTLGPPEADLTDFRSTAEAGSTPPVARDTDAASNPDITQ